MITYLLKIITAADIFCGGMFVMSIWRKCARYVPLCVTRYGANALDMFCKQNSILYRCRYFLWATKGGLVVACIFIAVCLQCRYGANALDMFCKQNLILLPLQIFSVAVFFLFYFCHGFASNCVVFGNE